ncbi:MAG TPA: hypothetical protein EYP62_09115 [Kiritimatiellae bacterium]|nr:hypothetical protein [Kiritimatiellia bacterium]
MRGRGSVNVELRWRPRSWPWDLEVLTVTSLLGAMFVPPIVAAVLWEGSASVVGRLVAGWIVADSYIWMLCLLGLYFGYVIWASLTLDYVSTPFVHLVAPLLFSIIMSGRIFLTNVIAPIVRGGVVAAYFSTFPLGVLVITLIIAVLRKRRHLALFDDVEWDISARPRVDMTFFEELVSKIQPLFYFPRMYHACGEGILIEGWTYIMPLPFFEMESINLAERGELITSGFYTAGSVKGLLRIKLYDRQDPVLISPVHPNLFMRYCEQLLIGLSPAEEEQKKRRQRELAEKTLPYGEPPEGPRRSDPYYNI